MSGRVRVTLADGRRVTGYRKTLRRQANRELAAAPSLWQVRFMLPLTMEFLGLRGQLPGIIGVEVIDGVLIVEGADPKWMQIQAAKFIKSVAPNWAGKLSAVLERAGQPAPTLSGPTLVPIKRVVELVFT